MVSFKENIWTRYSPCRLQAQCFHIWMIPADSQPTSAVPQGLTYDVLQWGLFCWRWRGRREATWQWQQGTWHSEHMSKSNREQYRTGNLTSAPAPAAPRRLPTHVTKLDFCAGGCSLMGDTSFSFPSSLHLQGKLARCTIFIQVSPWYQHLRNLKRHSFLHMGEATNYDLLWSNYKAQNSMLWQVYQLPNTKQPPKLMAYTNRTAENECIVQINEEEESEVWKKQILPTPQV